MSLTEKLDKLRQGAVDRVPAAAIEIMHRATGELRASGIVDGVLKVGAPAPAFALANINGETVRSAELLTKGPLVVSYYRGLW